ncbi:MAG: NUDIX hydrolase [bacterium]|nr:NUDIX hydrolase [bacterium]
MKYKYCSLCGNTLRQRKDGRLACTKCDFVNYQNPRPTVTVVVLHNNKLLLTKRAREPFQDWWDLPGGFIEKGERPEEAACRELWEETRLKIKIKSLFGIYPGVYPSKKEPFSVLSIVYIAECKTANLKALDDVAEGKWFEKEKIPTKIAFDSNQKVIKEFLRLWK